MSGGTWNTGSKIGPRKGERKRTQIFCAWIVLVLHAILVIALALAMIFYVDGTVFNTRNRYIDRKTFLRASDITTAVSAALVMVRAATTSWSGLTTWRCVFILLESGDGLNLQQLNRMVAWKFPTTTKGKHSLSVIVILLLMWPAQLAGPLLAGAVNWEATDGVISNGTKYEATCSEEMPWDQLVEDGASLHTSVGRASKEFIGLSQGDLGELGKLYPCRRYIYTDQRWPLGSAIEDYILPCIATQNISWDSTPPPKDVEDLLSPTGIRVANKSIFDLDKVAKTTVILNAESWTDTKGQPPLLFTGVKKVAIHLGLSNDTVSCYPHGLQRFGPSFPVTSIFTVPWRNDHNLTDNACFVVGTIHFTAGITRPPASKLITPKVVGADMDSTSQIQEDRAVAPAIYLMSNVMALISDQNLTAISTWNNLDGYINTLVSFAYFASWNVMDDALCDKSKPFLFDVGISVGFLRASVSKWRVYLWLAINLLFTLSGLVLFIIESESTRVVIDSAAAAITTDSSDLLGRDSDLRFMSYVTKEDQRRGKLKFCASGPPDEQETTGASAGSEPAPIYKLQFTGSP